jgi:hypothetical protein
MKRLAFLVILLPLAAGCPGSTDGPEVTCGAGTTLNGTTCVPDVVGGNNGVNNGGPASTCGPGTVLDPGTNVCEVENANLTECGQGTSLNPDTDQCEAIGDELVCGQGTSMVDGECVPDNPCPEGEVFRNGTCVPGAGLCGGGTVWREGECVPIDPLLDVALTEGPENNDPVYGGTALALTPGVDGDVEWVKGVIGAAENLDDEDDLEPDFDGYTFDAVAGQRLLLQATAVGVPSAAFEVRFLGEDPLHQEFRRLALPFGDRNAQREIVAPWDGTYQVRVGELSNLRGVGGEPSGGEGFTYLFGIGVQPAVETIAIDAGADQEGDILGVPHFLVDTADGNGVAIWLDTDEAVFGTWLTSGADFGEVAGPAQYVALPDGGVLVTVDHVEAAASDTQFVLRTAPVHLVDEVEPNQSADDATALGTLGPAILAGVGGFVVVDVEAEETTADWWSFSLDASTQVTIETSWRTVGADTTLSVYAAGDLEESVAFDDDGAGLYSTVSLELDSGDYLVLVRSYEDLDDGDYFLSVSAD